MLRERSFKDSIAARVYNELYDGIQEFIKGNPHDLDLRLYWLQDIGNIELFYTKVMFVDCIINRESVYHLILL